MSILPREKCGRANDASDIPTHFRIYSPFTIDASENTREKVVRASLERYTRERQEIEEKISIFFRLRNLFHENLMHFPFRAFIYRSLRSIFHYYQSLDQSI